MSLIPTAPRLFAAVFVPILKLVLCASLSAAEVETPAHVYASVRIINGNRAGSGKIISRNKQWAAGLTCAHLFDGKINGTFQVNYPDGSSSTAWLRKIDRSKDLALFFVPTKSVLEVEPVPRSLPELAKYDVCGYPQTEGPKFYALRRAKEPVVTINENGRDMVRWKFVTKDGSVLWGGEKILDQRNAQIIGGNSGSGISANGQVVSVLSHNGAPPGTHDLPSPVALGCPYDHLVAFLESASKERAQCGEWFAEPAAPVQAPLQTVAPPPAEVDESAPPPDWLKPNIKLDRTQAKGGKQKLPKDLKGNCNQGRELLAGRERDSKNAQHDSSQDDELSQLKSRMDAAEQRLGAVEGRPAERVVDKEKAPLPAPALPAPEKPSLVPTLVLIGVALASFMAASVVFASTLFGVLMAGKLLRFVGALFGK